MTANPERESSSRRGVRGVKDDLRRIFIGPIPGQYRDLCAILGGFAADCVVVDTMFLGALPLALGPRTARPALACIGVMPYAARSRDTAPFGVAFQPGRGPLSRVRNRVMNWPHRTWCWPTSSTSPTGAWPRPAHRASAATSSTWRPRWPTPTCRRRWPGSSTRVGPRSHGPLRRAHPGASLPLPSRSRRGGASSGRAARRARHPGHARQRRPGPPPPAHDPGAGGRRRAGRGHHRGARSRAVAPRPAGQRAPRALRPPRPAAPPLRRDGDQRRLRRGAAGTGQRGAPGGGRRQRGQARGGGACPVVGHRHQPAHRPALGGHGRPRRPSRPVPADVPGAGAGVQGEIAASDPLTAITATLAELERHDGRLVTRRPTEAGPQPPAGGTAPPCGPRRPSPRG